MKIDMVLVWVAVFMCVWAFQNFFTYKKTVWDVSYSYYTPEMIYAEDRQTVVSCEGDDLDWAPLKAFLVKDAKKEKGDDAFVFITILGTNKVRSDRYFRPFWKVLSSV